MLKRLMIPICFISLLNTGLETMSYAILQNIDTAKDSRALMCNDMLMVILNEKTDEVAN